MILSNKTLAHIQNQYILQIKGGLFMSTIPSYFKDFLSNIRLTDNQVNDLMTGHTTLRKRLEEDETLSKIIVSTFLQGSYRRSTAVKPKNGNKSDVDVIVTRKTKLEWIISENWNQQEISQRGKMNDVLLRKKMLLVGAGCVGASVAEILVRSGIYNLTIVDSDIFEVGNLSRHVLNAGNIGELKELSLCNHLNSLNPHANIEVINDKLTIDEESKTNIALDKYDIIIDCTGENSVLDVFQNVDFRKNHIIVSISVGLGAKHLYMTIMSGNTFCFNSFYKLISPYIQSERDLFDDYNLPRNGIGCWHPTFPARSDDVWLAAATSVKAIENYIITKSEKTLSIVYEQKGSDGLFEGYILVDKKEDG